MHGPDINRLDILVMDSADVETIVWSREGPQGNIWRLGKIKLNDITDMYSVCRFIFLFRFKKSYCFFYDRLFFKLLQVKVFKVILH